MKRRIPVVIASVHVCAHAQQAANHSPVSSAIGNDRHMKWCVTIDSLRIRIGTVAPKPIDERHVVIDDSEMKTSGSTLYEGVDALRVRRNFVTNPLHLLVLLLSLIHISEPTRLL